MESFSRKVDSDLLQKYRREIVKCYARALNKNEAGYLPESLKSCADKLKNSPHFGKLMDCLAEWFTLMELCEDLLHRVIDYKILEIQDFSNITRKLR